MIIKDSMLTGVEACVLSTIFVSLFDRKRKIKTGGYISGYRGSPLAGFDKTAEKYRKELSENHIEFVYGLNEDLALTSVAGTQLAKFFGKLKSNLSGIVGYWYGKGPGLDRSFDVIHHYNFQGTNENGGVILFCGDDLESSSSTMPHHSVGSLKSFYIPVLYPSSVEEIFELTLKGVYLSRYSGSFVGLKIITDIADAYQKVNFENLNSLDIKILEKEKNVNIILNDSGANQEYKIFYKRIPLIKRFIKENKINRIFNSNTPNNLGTICVGNNFSKLSEIFGYNFNFDILNLRCSWPLNEEEILEFTKNKDKILVIEEKDPIVEEQLKTILYDNNIKIDIFGSNILRREKQPTVNDIFEALKELDFIKAPSKIKKTQSFSQFEEFKRIPYFCGGCPHNTGTKLPKDSKALLGIGCHYLARFTDPLNTITINPMGYEGATWVSINKFLSENNHVFVNLGDGTYFHSGILSIRFAVANKTPVTYKILFNNVVGMTGGQNIDGELNLEKLVDQLLAEGVKNENIAIISHYYNDKNWKYFKNKKIKVFPKKYNIKIQEEFRKIKDVSVIIYDQMCATEKKRRIKRKLLENFTETILINKDICDGCGDCQAKSSCLSIEKELSLGIEKRYINQDSCALDKTCIDGFCPSFIKINRDDYNRILLFKENDFSNLIEKYYKENEEFDLKEKYKILIKGIGGTGTSTLNKIISDSFNLSNYNIVKSLDQTGLSQRYGEVFGKITAYGKNITEDYNFELFDLNIFLDYSLFLSNLNCINSKNIVVNTGSFNSIKSVNLPNIDEIKKYIDPNIKCYFVNFNHYLKKLNISTKNINVVILGYCFGKNLLPVSETNLLKSIKNNLGDNFSKYFKLGKILDQIQIDEKEENYLNQYHNILEKYDYNSYITFLELNNLIDNLNISVEHNKKLKFIVFDLLYKKDEFETARLWLEFLEENNIKRGKIYLSPPIFRKFNKKIGINVKILKIVFKILVKMKFVRNSIFDLFKISHDERKDLQYRKDTLDKISKNISNSEIDEKYIDDIFNKIKLIRGYGYIRSQNIEKYHLD